MTLNDGRMMLDDGQKAIGSTARMFPIRRSDPPFGLIHVPDTPFLIRRGVSAFFFRADVPDTPFGLCSVKK